MEVALRTSAACETVHASTRSIELDSTDGGVEILVADMMGGVVGTVSRAMLFSGRPDDSMSILYTDDSQQSARREDRESSG